MPELAEHIFAFARRSPQEQKARTEKRRAAESLTDVGSFQPHIVRPVAEQNRPTRGDREPRLGTALGSNTVAIADVRMPHIRREKVFSLLLCESPDLMICDLEMPGSLTSRENFFNAFVTPRVIDEVNRGLRSRVRQFLLQAPTGGIVVGEAQSTTAEEEEIHVHPIRSFPADPIPAVQRPIRLSQQIRLAIPPDDMPRQFAVRVDEEAE